MRMYIRVPTIALIILAPVWIPRIPGMDYIRMIYGITMLTIMTIGITLPMVTIIPIIYGGIITQNLKDPGL
jgi:hypothetical protein